MYDYFSKGHGHETELSFVITTYCMLPCMFLTDVNLTNFDVIHVSDISPPLFWIKIKHLKVETQQLLTW